MYVIPRSIWSNEINIIFVLTYLKLSILGTKGTAYTLITSKDKEFAGHLVRNLEGANQEVPRELLELALQVLISTYLVPQYCIYIVVIVESFCKIKVFMSQINLRCREVAKGDVKLFISFIKLTLW